MNRLEAIEQLEIFMDINQNQKAVSPSLRLVLEEDLFWNASRLDSRLKALRSSIVKELSVSSDPLQNKISVGEDKAELTFKPFYTALTSCGLLPKAKGNSYEEGTTEPSLYDINNHDNDKAMRVCKKDIVNFINKAYEFIEEQYPDLFNNEKFIVSNRGTYAFIMLLGSIHTYLFEINTINKKTSIKDRFEYIEPYLVVLAEGLRNLSVEEKDRYLIMKGAGADTAWFRLFQNIINKKYSEYEPEDLIDWKQRQDKKLQERAREYIESVEKKIKSIVLGNLKKLFGENWELEINSYKRKCLDRVEAEKEKQYKEGMPVKDRHWTEMLTIMDYKNLIEKYWSRKVEKDVEFKSFDKVFSLDIGEGFNSKSEKIKWISYLNNYRNIIAHAATKESGLNHDEVYILETINTKFSL